ncbi:MAG: PfkB family carbohydrate kinase [Pseudomonadota bacterium]
MANNREAKSWENPVSERFSIVGIGGAHTDRISTLKDTFRPGTSAPGNTVDTVGGVMFNCLRVAHLRCEAKTAIISARGGDPTSTAIEHEIELSGITDLSGVFLNRQSATYTAIHEPNGDVIAAVADMDIYQTALPRHVQRKPVLTAIKNAQTVILDANMPTETIAALANGVGGKLVLLGTSQSKIPRILSAAHKADLVFMNEREATALSTAANAELQAIFPRAALVITNGAKAVRVIDQRADAIEIQIPKAENILDVTGAGDALAGGTIAAVSREDCSIQRAVMEGIAAALCALEKRGAISAQSDLNHFEFHLAKTRHVNQ